MNIYELAIENHYVLAGKTHYFYGHSIAMLKFQRVVDLPHIVEEIQILDHIFIYI